MDDRITEIREALNDARQELDEPEVLLTPSWELVVAAASAYAELLDSDALIIRRDEFYDPHDDLIGLRDFIDKRESLEFPDIGEVSNQLAAIIAKLTVVDALASSQGVEP